MCGIGTRPQVPITSLNAEKLERARCEQGEGVLQTSQRSDVTSTATPSPDLDTQPQQNVSPIPASRGRWVGKAGSLLQLTGWRLWVGPLPTEPLPEAASPALHLTPGAFPPRASRNPCPSPS